MTPAAAAALDRLARARAAEESRRDRVGLSPDLVEALDALQAAACSACGTFLANVDERADGERWLDTAQVAERWGKSQRAVRGLAKRRSLDGQQLTGGRWVFRAEVIQEYERRKGVGDGAH
jgi:hypothetical protein